MPRLGFDGSMMTRHEDSQRSDRLAVTFADLRVVDRVVASIASSPRLGRRMPMKRHDDSQRSDRLVVTQLTVHSPLTTHHSPLTTHPLTRSPAHHSPASRPANRTAAECAAPVLSAATAIRVAHTRYTSVRLTADEVGRKLHRSTPACVATLAGTSIQTTDTSVPDQSCRRRMRASRGTGWSDGQATVLSGHPIAQKKGGAK